MNASFRGAQRSLDRWGALPPTGGTPTVETLARAPESPRLVTSTVVEGSTDGAMLTTRTLDRPPTVGFGAFLDGIQASRIVVHHGIVPIVHGTVAAVIRERRDRRLVTHGTGPLIDRALYAPRDLVAAELWTDLASHGVVDTGPIAPADTHPTALLERGVHVVQERRQAIERKLAESWSGPAPLWVDGGIAKLASSPNCVGVVQAHRTLYVGLDSLGMLTTLKPGERTTVFRLTAKQRTSVLSWYLRLRDPAGRAPLWGLVRIEIPEGPETSNRSALTQTADEVSSWVLAEVAPLTMPDAHWDTLVYGVKDCESYLQAVC